MSSLRESIFEALRAGLAGTERTIARNAPITDLDGVFFSLRDGKSELVEEFINPPIYEFVLRPVLTIVVASAMPEAGHGADDFRLRDQLLDTAIEDIGAAFSAIVTWPQQVTDWQMIEPEFDTHEILGAAGMKGCEIPFEIEYWTDRRQG